MADTSFVGSQAFNQIATVHEDVIPNTGSLVLNVPVIDLMGKLDGIGLKLELSYLLGKKGRFGLPDNWSFGVAFLTPGDSLEINGGRYVIDPTWKDSTGYASGLKYQNNHGIKFTDFISQQPLPYGKSGMDYQYTYTDIDGLTYFFSSLGYLLMKADRFGNFVYYAYTTSNLLDYIVDSFGQKTTFGYYPSQIIITFPDGRTTSINHASNGVSSIVDPLGQTISVTSTTQGAFSVISTIAYPSGKQTQVSYGSVNFRSSSGVTGAIPVVSDLQFLDSSGALLSHTQYAYGTNAGGNTFTGYTGNYSLSDSSDGLLESNNTLYLYDVQVSQLDANGNYLSRVDTLYSFAHVPTQRNSYVIDSSGMETGHFQLNSSYNLTPDKHNQQPNYLLPKDTEQVFVQTGGATTSQKKTAFAYDEYGNQTQKTVSLFDIGTGAYVINTQDTATYFAASGMVISSLIESFEKKDCLGNEVIRTTNTLTGDQMHVGASSITVSTDGGSSWNDWKEITQGYDTSGRETSTSVKWTKPSMPGVQQTPRRSSYALDAAAFTVATTVTDSLGNTLILKTSTMYGAKVAVIASSGNTTTFGYDKIGRLVTKTLPSGQTTTRTYKSMAADGENSTTETNVIGYSKRSVFDALMRETASFDNGDSTNPGAERQLSTKTYDMAGNVVVEGDMYGNSTICQYNSLGKPTSTVDPQGNATAIAYDYASNTTTTSINAIPTARAVHDNAGRVIEKERLPNTTIADPVSQYTVRTQTTYDGQGNKLSKVVSQVQGSTVTTLSQYSYQYNSDSICVRETFSAQDGAKSVTTYSYDINSKLISQLVTRDYPGGDSFTHDGEASVYDGLGNQTSITNAAGQSEKFTYDGDGLMTTKTLYDGTTITFAYNKDGQVVTQTWSDGATTDTVAFGYDKLGRMTSITDSQGTMTTDYALDGSVTANAYPDGKKVTYKLDQYSRKVGQVDTSGLETTYAYTATNQLSSVSNGLDTITYSYYKDTTRSTMFGAPQGMVLANSYAEVYQYDAFNRRNRLERTDASGGAVMLSESNIFSPLDQLTSTDMSSAVSSDASLNHSRAISYDGFSQVTQDAITGGNSAKVSDNRYSYDGNSNVLTRTDVSGTQTRFTYNNIEQLTSYSVGSGAAQTQTYDTNGRLTMDGEGRKYTYDIRGNLLGVSSAANSQIYAYYPNRMMASRGSGSTSTAIYYDNNQQAVTTYDGATPTQFLMVGSKRFASYVNGAKAAFLGTNQRQDTVCVTTGSGVAGQTTYDPYGRASGKIGLAANNNFAWNQEYADTDNALVYLRSRYYDPVTMRFISRDTKQVRNRYAYCKGDPINNTDPTGHDAENWVLSGAIGIGVIGAVIYVALTFGSTISAAAAAVGGAGTIAAVASGTLASTAATLLGVGPLGSALVGAAVTGGLATAADVSIGSAVGAALGSAFGSYLGGSLIGGQAATMLGGALGGTLGGYAGTTAGAALGLGETTVLSTFTAATEMLGTASATATSTIAAVGDAIGAVASTTVTATTATVTAVGDAVGAVTATAASVAATTTEAVGAAAAMTTEAIVAAGAAVGIESASDAVFALLPLIALAFL
jgi:RHS repeat-associated protein